MTPYGFLAWVATQGIKHIPKKFLYQAFNSFKGKLPSNQVILKTAKNLYDDVIKKTPTKDLTKQLREGMKKDRPFPGFKPTAVPKKGMFDNIFTKMYKEVMGPPKVVKPKLKVEKSKQIIEGMKPKGPKVVNIGDRIIKQMQKEGKTVKFDDLVRIYGKKKPPTLKADGGRIDKALPKRSRDI